MRERIIKAFLALHPNSDGGFKDQLRNKLRISERDILLSRAKTASSGSGQLKSFLDGSPLITELVIVAEKHSAFALNPDFRLLGQLSQQSLLLRYWTLDTRDPDSVLKVLRKAGLVRLSNLELFNRGLRITNKYSQEPPLKKGDNCF